MCATCSIDTRATNRAPMAPLSLTTCLVAVLVLARTDASSSQASQSINDIAILDCSGGLHVLPGGPLEVNANVRGLRTLANAFFSEVTAAVQCAVTSPTAPVGCSLTPSQVEMFFTFSVPWLLNRLAPPALKQYLPPECQSHAAGAAPNGAPLFGSTFFESSSSVTTQLSYLWNAASSYFRGSTFVSPATVVQFESTSTCTLDAYNSGGCAFSVRDEVSDTSINVGISRCPNSAVPYVSVGCSGPWCESLLHPCTSDADCSGGTVCTVMGVHSGTVSDLLANALTTLGLINDVSDFNCPYSYLMPDSRTYFAQQLINLQQTLWGLPVTAATESDSATTPLELAVCLPTAVDGSNAAKTLSAAVTDTVSTNLMYDDDVSACVAKGCDVAAVGDGFCDMQCYSQECQWDGSDCGGPALRIMQDDPSAFTIVDPSIPSTCLLSLPAATAAGVQASWLPNFFESCNGVGTCLSSGQCQCGNCQLQVGSTSAGPFCENCVQQSMCSTYYNTCKAQRVQLTGLQRLMRDWDGVLPDGSSVFAADRVAGRHHTTPSAVFDVPGLAEDFRLRPLLQVSCAGEVGVNLFNGQLQFSVHMPALQFIIPYLVGWVETLQACRIQSPSYSGMVGPTPSPLPPAVFDYRFLPHHLATWAYQYSWFGGRSMAEYPSPQFSFGPNTQGGITFTDLLTKAGRREPPLAGTPTPSPGARDSFSNSAWGRGTRVEGLPSNCSFWSSVFSGDAGATGSGADRQCTATWAGLNGLFAQAKLLVHADVRQDKCANAVTGWGGASTLSFRAASNALPTAGVYVQGWLPSYFETPTACATVADCVSYFSAATGITPTPAEVACVDMDTDMITMSNLFQNRAVNPIGYMFGRYNTGWQKCATYDTLRGSLRSMMMGLGGAPARGPPYFPAPTAAPKFCMQNLKTVNTSWPSGLVSDSSRQCTTLGFNDPRRLCLDINVPFPAPAYRGGGVVLNGLGDAVIPDLFVPQGSEGAAGWTQSRNMIPGAALPFTRSESFAITLPGYTLQSFTGNTRETLRWALGLALAGAGAGVPSNALRVDEVLLCDSRCSGVSVRYTVSAPDDPTLLAVSLQLCTNGLLQSTIGLQLAQAGLVDLADKGGVVLSGSPIGGGPSTGGSGSNSIIVLAAGIAAGACVGGAMLAAAVVFYMKPKWARKKTVTPPKSGGAASAVELAATTNNEPVEWRPNPWRK